MQLFERAQVAPAAYHDVRMRVWHGDRVALLGDAAHALSAQLGQGENLVLMDAAALARRARVASAPRGSRPLPEALVAYSAARRKHLRFYQFATRWTTPFFQSDLLPLGLLRDLAFRVAQMIPVVRRQMTATMARGKTGPFGSLRDS